MHTDRVDLGASTSGWFTGRDLDRPDPPIGAAGNLAHRRPHRPVDLAADRARLGALSGTDPARWHLMHQVHGAEVGVVTASTPPGAELREVDALVTAEVDRPLVVQVADCVPVLLAAPAAVGVAHAGRAGVAADVVGAAVDALLGPDGEAEEVVAAVGPAIGGCCYELPADVVEDLGAAHPAAVATTTWGTPSFDLKAAVVARLRSLGVAQVLEVGRCTRCDSEQRWFSHRRDATTGRQVGLVVRGVAA